MGSSPFRSIFLPSLVSAGLAFAVITLPLSMANSVPTWVSSRQTRGDLVSPLDNSAKPIIRYIGFAIIASVTTGTVTAEVLRRIYRKRLTMTAAPEPFKVSPAPEESEESAPDMFDVGTPNSLAMGSSTTLNGQGLLATKLAPGHTVVRFTGYTQQEAVDGLELAPMNLEELIQLDSHETLVDVPILTFLDQVEPTHLDTGDAMVFGVRYQNKYYCLWRSHGEKDRVMGWARRLIKQHRDVIVTKHEQGQYSLWYVPQKHLR